LLETSLVPIPASAESLSEIRGYVNKGKLSIPQRYLELYDDDYIEVEGYENNPNSLKTLAKIMARLEVKKMLNLAKIIEIGGLKVSARDLELMVRKALHEDFGRETIEMPRGMDKTDLRKMITSALNAKLGRLSD